MHTYNSDHHEFSAGSESEDDYIVMEIHHDPPLEYSHKIKEFEFPRFSSCSIKKDHQATADELFYMGKLLPLQFTPRLEMLKKIFTHKLDTKTDQYVKESFKTPLVNTEFDSCSNVSSSRDLKPQENLLQCSNVLIRENKSWTKKVIKWANVKTFGQIKYKKLVRAKEEHRGSSRFTRGWSLSGGFKMKSKINNDLQVLKRSGSSVRSSSDTESRIQPAIDLCSL